MTAHLARYRLEQLIADDPRAKVPPALRVHLASCDECSVRKRAIESARAEFLARRPPEEFARTVLVRAAELVEAPKRRLNWLRLRSKRP